ncbi:MAG: hypothetical protein KC435_08100 [Thermomicrobiales bacterium]|nr:hypothetical protein [Thermomicrobiales bacterium]
MRRIARRRTPGALALVSVVFLYAGIRLLDLNRLVTTDEPFWLGASANFYRALRTGEYAYTYQLEHPGVMTLWAGAIAFWLRFPEYSSLVSGNLDGLGGMYSIESVLRSLNHDPLALMVAAKVVKVIVQTVFFGFGLIFLKKCIGSIIALSAGVLIAFGRFLTGLDSALHVDGMAAITTFAGFCAIVYATEQSDLTVIQLKPVMLWMVAGFFCATAWLTRYPAILILGVVGLGLLLLLVDMSRSPARPSTWVLLRNSLIYGLAWLTSGVLTTVILWPALWVAPRATLIDIWNYSLQAARKGHENPLIFMGVVKYGDPGWLFYPVSLLYRASVTDWIGLVAIFIFGVWGYKKQILTKPMTRITIMALVYIVVFVVTQSFGAKKFDRYLLPVYPLLTLVGTFGLYVFGNWVAQRTRRPAMYIAPIILGIALNIVFVNSILPYRLDYFSPLMGGAKTAITNMQMGWGQGGDQVVDYLAEQEADGPIIVQTSAVPSAFTYFLTDNSSIQFKSFGLGTPAGWYETDYYVAGIQQTQRNLDPWYDLFTDRDPVKSVEIGGVSYFDIYAVRSALLPAQLSTATACNYSFGSQITLMQIIGRDTTIDVYFLSEEGVTSDPVTLNISIKPGDGSTLMQEVTFTPANPGLMNKVTINTIDGDLQTAQFTISATISGETAEVTAPWLSAASTAATTQSECYYTEPPTS